MKFQDLLPPNTEAEWTCGHIGGAMCAECFRILAQKATKLAEENLALLDRIDEMQRHLERDGQEIRQLRNELTRSR